MHSIKTALRLAGCLSLAGGALAKTNDAPFISWRYVERVGSDMADLPSVIAHWDGADWLTAGAIAGAGYAGYTVDGDVRRDLVNHHPEQLGDLSSFSTHFGDWRYELPILTGAWIGGMVFKSQELSRVAADGIEASAIAAGVMVPVLNYLTGRDLPNKNLPAYDFHPFHRHLYSFPSGHTAEAFAIATVVDQDLRERFGYWHTPLVYAIASGVGFSRIRDQRHYLSDVIIGAGIGWSVARWVARRHHPRPAGEAVPLTAGRVPAPALQSDPECVP